MRLKVKDDEIVRHLTTETLEELNSKEKGGLQQGE
jgi:hypothetical protein